MDSAHIFTGDHRAYLRYLQHFEPAAGYGHYIINVDYQVPTGANQLLIGQQELYNGFGGTNIHVTDIGGVFNWRLPAKGHSFFALYCITPTEGGYEYLTTQPHLMRMYHGMDGTFEPMGTQDIGSRVGAINRSMQLNRTLRTIWLPNYDGVSTLNGGLITVRGAVGRRLAPGSPPPTGPTRPLSVRSVAAQTPATVPRFIPRTTEARRARGMMGEATSVYEVEYTGDPTKEYPVLYIVSTPDMKGELGMNWQDPTGTRIQRLAFVFSQLFFGSQTTSFYTKVRVATPSSGVPQRLNRAVDTRGQLLALLYKLKDGTIAELAPGFDGFPYPFNIGSNILGDQLEEEANAPTVNKVDAILNKLMQQGYSRSEALSAMNSSGMSIDELYSGIVLGVGLLRTAGGLPLMGPAVNHFLKPAQFTVWTWNNSCKLAPSKCLFSRLATAPISPVPIKGIAP